MDFNRDKEFLLLNKDTPVLVFSISSGEFGENYNVRYVLNRGLIPKDLRDLRDWLDKRYILSHRHSIKVFFNVLGISSMSDFIKITNCISLKDTYWVKVISSKLHWDNVSPYKNPLNKAIADYSFERTFGGKRISGSPDFSTDGNFPKCWKKTASGLYLYKAGSSGACNAGNEPYSEVYAYNIAKELGIKTVAYELGEYKGKLITRCKCITSERVGLISYKDLYNMHYCDFEVLLSRASSEIEQKYLIDMLLLDYITCNVDRHYGNIGLLLDNDKNEVLGYSPLYDHNLSCLPYYLEDESLDYYISDIRAKDGRTWEELYRLIDCKYVRDKVKRLKGKTFSIGSKRDKVVNKMIETQVKRVL